jgi:hypothetical protein
MIAFIRASKLAASVSYSPPTSSVTTGVFATRAAAAIASSRSLRASAALFALLRASQSR